MEAFLDLPKTKRSNNSPVVTDVGRQVILHNISYEKILAEQEEVGNPHFAFCDGELEIMVLGYQHERLKDDLTELTVKIARILEIDYRGAASTKFRRQKKQKGFEGDSSFYFKTRTSFVPKRKLI